MAAGSTCTTAMATATALSSVSTEMQTVPGHPFGIASTSDGQWSFVSLDTSVAVLSNRSSPPTLTNQVSVTGGPAGLALTEDDRYLLVAAGGGVAVIDTGRAERSAPQALVGTLSAPGGSGAVEVAVSSDRRLAFVTLEASSRLAVFDLGRALTRGFGAASLIGTVPLGRAPVGIAVSPDGSRLYVTSETGAGGPGLRHGTLSVIDTARAAADPSQAVISTVDAGCSPVRAVVSADGTVIWVSARGDDAVLGFSTARVVDDPAHARVATVAVGEEPVGLCLVAGDRRLIVADSNRSAVRGVSSDLEVIDTRAALTGEPAVLGRLPSGSFPRELVSVPNRSRVQVTNYAPGQLETIDLANLP